MQKTDPSVLLLVFLLICCSVLSPSNGIDDAVNSSGGALISKALHILFFSVFAYLLINLVTLKKQP